MKTEQFGGVLDQDEGATVIDFPELIPSMPGTLPTESELHEQALTTNPEALEAHLLAVAGLHHYNGAVVERTSMRTPSTTPFGTFHEELVCFSDGARRTLTRGVPNPSWFGSDGISPFPISATDALGTGPTGFNRHLIERLVREGYPVEWLHHQGRHGEKPTDISKALIFARFLRKKSVGRSAHHQHGLLDDLSSNADYDASKIVSIGDSRGAMTGEAVDALADMYDREIIYSDYIGSCFEHFPASAEDVKDLLQGAVTIPYSVFTLAKYMIGQSGEEDAVALSEYGGTFDLHPMNVVHELAWTIPLLRGDAGRYANAVPLNRVGARTYLSGDAWSSRGKSWEPKHSIRPGIRFLLRHLPDGEIAYHLHLAHPEIQGERTARLARLNQQAHATNLATNLIDFNYVINGPKPLRSAA